MHISVKLALPLAALLVAGCDPAGTMKPTTRPDAAVQVPATPTGPGVKVADPVDEAAAKAEAAKTAQIAKAPAPRASARTVAELDTVSAAQKKAATEKPAASAETKLGTSIASLGDPTEGGLWLKTPLVGEATTGRVEYKGNSAKVDLRPLAGPVSAGSQISLSAMKLLKIGLTELPTITVYRN